MKGADILGVFIDPITPERLAERLQLFFEDGQQHIIVTPNPEMVLLARRDEAFRKILNAADLAIADGAGLIFASQVLDTEPISSRITGVDTLELLAKLCAQEGKKLMLLGGAPSVARLAAEKLAMGHGLPGQAVSTVSSASIVSDEGGIIEYRDGEWQMNPAVLEHVKQEAPDVLAVALGHGKQEKWIRDFLPHLPSVKIAIGVGGAFDYLAGRVRRAPRLVRRLGLEWLCRLIHEPKRLPRIWRAVVVFTLTVIWAKMKMTNATKVAMK